MVEGVCSKEETNVYPKRLAQIVELFTPLSEEERCELLVAFADTASRYEPKEGERFDLEDVRKDEECTDTVGVFLRLDPEKKLSVRMRLGPAVQTLTKAMTSILCEGLEGATLEEILELSSDFVPKIVGGQLVRIRSQTVYYVLGRIRAACQVLARRRQALAATPS
ncbi:SufE family protein [Candidatus Methylacidithermus pantelleriae]|uniref:SufE domain-containing protein n=1 Tax=Candidatus Methylacidithermus pantelleriae TaxID=2744239 RepID=A0A8J2BSF5_9BACT|nr:SufE family protein [Candidatus Methylacidithermus pantelleriae]CAF0703922.1 SufE domain-containing protein [Candidatus Methylacidithermus pantelleriae]